MAINKKLIHFQTLANFEAQLSAGNILDSSICFIKDAKLIWTHGVYYAQSDVYVLDLANIDTSTGNGDDILGSISGEEFAKLQKSKMVVISISYLSNSTNASSSLVYHNLNDQTVVKYIDIDTGKKVEYTITLQEDGTALVTGSQEDLIYLGEIDGQIITDGDIRTKYIIEDLTLEEIQFLSNGEGESSYPFNVNKVKTAFNQNLPVFIKYAEDGSGMAGLYHVEGYYEDLLYLRIVNDQNRAYLIELNLTATNITSDNIKVIDLPRSCLFYNYGESGTISMAMVSQLKNSDIAYIAGASFGLTQANVSNQGNTVIVKAVIEHMYQEDGLLTGIKTRIITVNGLTGEWTAETVESYTPWLTSQLVNDSNYVKTTGLKTINGQSIVGSGDITIEDGGDTSQFATKEELSNYLPTSGGYAENLEVTTLVTETTGITQYIDRELDELGNSAQLSWDDKGIYVQYTPITGGSSNTSSLNIVNTGDGTQFLSDDGTYKSISSSAAYPILNSGATGSIRIALQPNKMYVFGELTNLGISSFIAGDSTVVNEYVFQFTSGATATTLTLPSDIKWANDVPLVIESNMIYQISVLNNCATSLAFSSLNKGTFSVNYKEGNTKTFTFIIGMSWEEWINSDYNVNRFYIYGQYVFIDEPRYITDVVPTDIIADGVIYNSTPAD